MNTTCTRRNTVIAALVGRAAATARRSLQMLIVSALAVGTILLALSGPVALAGPGDGPGGSENPTLKPPKLHASENPVVFGPSQTVKWISVTAQPYTVTVRAIFKQDGVQLGPGPIYYPGATIDIAADITYGKTYTARLETIPENGMPKEVGPLLTIKTVREDVATYNPQPPEISINPTLTPRRPAPPSPGDEGAAEEAPGIGREAPGVDRNPRTVESPGSSTIS